jgi:hypothetical protein
VCESIANILSIKMLIELKLGLPISVPGLIFTEGPYWLQLRRFTLRHLRDFGYGKTSMESLIMQEVDDLIKEISSKDTVQVMTPWRGIRFRRARRNRILKDPSPRA